MIKRKRNTLDENAERWLLTYADLITLLLALFIVMYSMSSIDAGKFDSISSALSGVLRGQDMRLRPKGPLLANDPQSGGPLDTRGLTLLQQRLESHVEESGQSSSVSSVMTGRGLVIHILEGALFEEGKATLTPGARDVLRSIGEEVRATQNHVRVEGHTDPRPIHTVRFPSNWELSTARATAVLRFMVDSLGVPATRISALGFGEFRPLVPNDSPRNMAKNRRVDIVVLSREMSLSEPEGTAYPMGKGAASRSRGSAG